MILLTLALQDEIKAQLQLENHLLVLSHPAKLHFDFPSLEIERWPLYRYDVQISWLLDRNFFLEAGLPLQYTRLSYDILFRDVENNEYPAQVVENYIYVGVKGGMGFMWEAGRGSRLFLPLGAEIFNTQLSAIHLYIQDQDKIDFLPERKFSESLGYSFYFNPRLQLAWQGKKYQPWHFSMTAYAALVKNEFMSKEQAAVLVLGGGLGVVYVFQ